MEKKNNYISIPYKVMLNKRLTQTQKIVFGFIEGFKNSKNICYASNAYIAKVIGLKETAVSRAISKLVSEDMVDILNPKGRSRSLYCKTDNPVSQDHKPVLEDGLSLSPKTDNNLVNNLNNKPIYNLDNTTTNNNSNTKDKENSFIYIDRKRYKDIKGQLVDTETGEIFVAPF